MGTGGRPPEIDLFAEYVGTTLTPTYRFRIELHAELTAAQYSALQDRLSGANRVHGPGTYDRADAVSYILETIGSTIGGWDSHSQQLIKVAVNPEGYKVQPLA